jgi:hypothetical protein
MLLLGCEEVCRWLGLLTGDVLDASRDFFDDRFPFFLDKRMMLEESVAAPRGLRVLGGEEGGVASGAAFWYDGVVILFWLRRLFRGPLGVKGG